MLGLFVKNLAESLAPFCKISVLHISAIAGQSKPIVLDEKTEDGILTVSASISSRQRYLFQRIVLAFRWIVAFQQCWKAIRKKQGTPDLAHVHVLTRPGILALWLKWFHGIPFIISEHWSRYFPENNQFKGFVRKVMTRHILKQSCALICVSESLYSAMKKNGLTHAVKHTIPNVVNTQLFHPLAKKPKHDFYDVIHISCFEEQSKNITGLLKGMKIVCSMRNDVRLQLVGDGHDKSMVESLALELGLLPDVVVFRGTLLPVEVTGLLQQADFLVQTSHYETFGTVVAESLACGVPVISTGVGIFPEIFTPKLGVLIRSTNDADIAEAILEAIGSISTFNSIAMRELAITHFSYENVGQRLFQIYQSHLKPLHRP